MPAAGREVAVERAPISYTLTSMVVAAVAAVFPQYALLTEPWWPAAEVVARSGVRPAIGMVVTEVLLMDLLVRAASLDTERRKRAVVPVAILVLIMVLALGLR